MKNLIIYISVLFLFAGCALQNQVSLLLPTEEKVVQKENKNITVKKVKKKKRVSNCKKDFTEVSIKTYRESNRNYYFDISSFEGRRDRISLRILNPHKFKTKEFKKCFISPAAWLMITQPERFEFYIDKEGDFKYNIKGTSKNLYSP